MQLFLCFSRAIPVRQEPRRYKKNKKNPEWPGNNTRPHFDSERFLNSIFTRLDLAEHHIQDAEKQDAAMRKLLRKKKLQCGKISDVNIEYWIETWGTADEIELTVIKGREEKKNKPKKVK